MPFQVLTSRSHDQPLGWVEYPDKPLRRDEVRVQVAAVGVNPVDWKMRQGDFMGMLQRLVGPSGPLVCGVDFAGTVSEIGAAVSDVAVGDRVVGGTDFSRGQHGSYARRVQVRADQVAHLPDEVNFESAACLPVAGVTAHRALFALGRLDRKPGGRALVFAASGGVGHFAVQLARIAGVTAVGTCSTRNLSLVERLGGTAIDYSRGDVPVEAGARGPYDVIVDGAGAAAYPVSTYSRLLAPGGTYILVMPRPRDYWRVAVPGPVRTILGRPNRSTLEPLVKELAAGRLEVVIAERIPLDEAERAHQVSRSGKVAGKLVLVA